MLKLSAISYQLSAISYQLSAISYQLSAISYQLSAISYQLSAISYQLSAISYQGDINMRPLYINKQNYDKCVGFVCKRKACLRKKRSF
ncbi:hypothetical protein [Pseudoalteromonas sp. R86517]|uniref:hypothetical protein n=1 Tax=Pseudoalteromonas sp. R86517 TaxID=3093857 RepID=UPI00366EF517